MADAAVIKEFLVKLGYKIDASSEGRFDRTIATATKRAVELGAAVVAAAAAVTAGVAKMAEQFESLSYTAQRTRSTVQDIQRIGYAASQMGSSFDAARASIESIGQKLRTMPGFGGVLAQLGIDPKLDPAAMLARLGDRFRSMPYYRANAYAEALGIDTRTLDSMIAGMDRFADQYGDMLKKAGVDSEAAAAGGRKFMQELRGVGAALDVLGQKVSLTLTTKLSRSLADFRVLIVANYDRITRIITAVASAFLTAAEVAGRFFSRLVEMINASIDAFGRLDPRLQEALKVFGALLIAWKVLNIAFLASPVGRVLALAAALVTLWDDYKTWKEGGESAINWEKWEPQLKGAVDLLGRMASTIGRVVTAVAGPNGWQVAFAAIAAYIGGSWLLKMTRPLLSILGMLAMIPGSGVSAGAVAALAAGAGVGVGGVLISQSVAASESKSEALSELLAPMLPGVAALGRLGNWLLGGRGRAATRNGAGGGSGGARGGTGGGAENVPTTGNPSGMQGLDANGRAQVSGEIPPEGRALLATIGQPESGGRYNVRYAPGGGVTFSDLSKHPNIIEQSPYGGSSAAGRYQFTGSTWRDVASRTGRWDFSPASQDYNAWSLAVSTYRQKNPGRDLLADLKSGDPAVRAGVAQALRGHWPTLPGGGQSGGMGMDTFDRRFSANLAGENARPAPAPNISQSNSNVINVAGAMDPATGDRVLRELDRSKADIVRNQRGSVQ